MRNNSNLCRYLKVTCLEKHISPEVHGKTPLIKSQLMCVYTIK